MSEYGAYARLRYTAEDNTATSDYPNFDGKKYPYTIPEFYIEGKRTSHSASVIFKEFFEFYDTAESIVSVENGLAVKYTRHTFDEFLVKDDQGNDVWVDSRTTSDENLLYHQKQRTGREYEIEELNLETKELRLYTVKLESVTKLCKADFMRSKDSIERHLK